MDRVARALFGLLRARVDRLLRPNYIPGKPYLKWMYGKNGYRTYAMVYHR